MLSWSTLVLLGHLPPPWGHLPQRYVVGREMTQVIKMARAVLLWRLLLGFLRLFLSALVTFHR